MEKHRNKELGRELLKATEAAMKDGEPYVVDRELSKNYFEELIYVEEQTKRAYDLVEILSKR